MYQIAQNFTLHLILSFTVCASLLLLPGVSLLSEASQGQEASGNARPRHKKPEGILPDLEDVKNESHLQREAPPPIPSTVRAKRNEGKPWDGRRVGDPGSSQRPVDQPDEERQTRRAHARRRVTPPPLSEDQFIQNFFNLALLVRSTDGTQLSFAEANGEYRCTQIKDRNGNYISVNYNTQGQLTTITDTLGRIITFNYDGNANLLSIKQAWNGQPEHQWVSFGWSQPNMQYSFADAAVVGIKNGDAVPVLTQVALNDTSSFTFEYTNPLQVSVIKKSFGPLERNTTTFGYETLSGDVPRLTSSSVSAMNWTGVNGLPAQVTTQYSVAGNACIMTAPDGTVYKEYYGTGWQKGLTVLSEVWVGTDKKKWTTTAWTQDNTSVSYETNPRVTETNVYDNGGNRRRTTIDYGPYAQWGLPYLVSEYAAGGSTEIRRTFTDYNLSQVYLDPSHHRPRLSRTSH